jgi:predicted DCC family thiol-disulfide oxidoreductase YuxK
MSKIILFDGVCNFCNSTINFVIDHDVKDIYMFASLQSEIGQKYLKKYNLPLDDFDTFVLIDGDTFYVSSTAALLVAKDLDSILKYLYILILIPRPIRDMVYKLIAKNRYSIFGKSDSCRIPTEKEKDKFLN